MKSEITDIDPVIAVVDEVCDAEETCQPFGKRWGGDFFTLTAYASVAGSRNRPVLSHPRAAPFLLVPKLQLGNPAREAPASRGDGGAMRPAPEYGKLELPPPRSQAGAWERAKLGEQMAKGAELDRLIRQKLAGLGYEF